MRTTLFLLTLMAAGCATTEAELPKRYTCVKITAPVAVDGRMDDAAWNAAAWTDWFVDIEGDVKPRPRFQTRAKMLWDDTYFYVAAWMEEPHVWGSLTEHDQIVFHDNDFEVFIDPDGDTAQYYEIEVNALNTIFDLFLHKRYLDGGPADHDWNAEGLRTAIYVDGTLNDPSDVDRFWSVEMAIPWATLAPFANRPSPPHAGDTWRVNFSRVQWQHVIREGRYRKRPDTKEDNWVWSPQGKINMHLPRHWGYVTFAGPEAGG
ncbi:MAG: carbohydrate-binding family 9-like protein [Phycisphaerales bacterium]|nr:carbohydrate-binding family 9-like protein [Phycisphaerae bacterium]NNF41809.1 carbohydrate-binding family 9-like protein [Phycisphaerales bacterium]NNM25584.1 carbohydrate-binding family 9-like protein [Phycisphaerales bacterium]